MRLSVFVELFMTSQRHISVAVASMIPLKCENSKQICFDKNCIALVELVYFHRHLR